ncbi:hypothetical protein ACJMK2_026163 [Sinanodonta woodiana]|uniref:Uncharacterized protein n=1 Tax=Sinanodonta woodiana TaxID=1069815 RepID=A0ABD3XM75_SINWO
MGNICCCTYENDSDSPQSTIRSPLLGSQTLNPHYTQTDYQSARQYNPREDMRPFEKHTDSLTLFEMTTVPVTSIDTQFKDQAKLYNDAVDAYKHLQLEIHNLKRYFLVETRGIPELKKCLQILASRCDVARITIKRKSRTLIEVYYDEQHVSETCTVTPERVLEPLRHYKNAFKHVHDALHYMPELKENISVIINDEKAMLRETIEVDPMRDGGVEGMRAITSNIKKLKKMNLNVCDVEGRAQKTFNELVEASKYVVPDISEC